MTSASVRVGGVLLAAVWLCGCSFEGSVTEVSATTSAASASSTEHPSSTEPSRTSEPSSSHSAAGSTTAAPTTAGSSSATPGTPARCRTADLTATLVPGSSGAGQRHAALVLTDAGTVACTIHGYGGLGLAGPDGEPLPTRQVRVRDPAPATVTLRPGGSATAQVDWSAVAGSADAQSGNCQPVPATLRVIPPDETEALSVRWDQGPVCEGGTLDQQAYVG